VSSLAEGCASRGGEGACAMAVQAQRYRGRPADAAVLSRKGVREDGRGGRAEGGRGCGRVLGALKEQA
jgi:hypothetical protein